MTHILLVDDDLGFTQATQEIISLLGHEVTVADSIAEARLALTHHNFDILLLDIMLPDGNGLDLLEQLPQPQRPRHIAFITGHSAIKSLIKSVAGPGVSYLLKPIDLDAIRNLLQKAEIAAAVNEADSRHFGALVGETAVMHSLYDMIRRVAATRANVMIQGESGTGKELVAQAIHNASDVSGRFVAANCGAISAELIGSELFGHEKGAFTGAVNRKIGLFEQAQNGTLFLDEVTEMPLDQQTSRLRVLETGKLTRIGGTQEIEVNCRVVSATNRTFQQIATENCLREDIYFRLAVFPLQLPPLRERREDIPRLCDYFLQQFNQEQGTDFGISDTDMQRLLENSWRGNIRELRHLLYRSFILSDPSQPYLAIPEQIDSPFSQEPEATTGLQAGSTIQEIERELIQLTLAEVDGDKPKAAEMLGISLKTLYNRLNQYEQE